MKNKFQRMTKEEQKKVGNLSVLNQENFANHYKMVIFLSNFNF